MQLPFSESVPLEPGAAARLLRVRPLPRAPTPGRFIHFHGPAELVLIEKGTGQFLCEDTAFAYGPGSILYAPSMAVHDFVVDHGPRALTLIQFDPHAASQHALPSFPLGVIPEPDALTRIRMLIDWLAESITAQSAQSDIALLLQSLMLAVTQSATQTVGRLPEKLPSLSKFRPLLDQLSREPWHTLRLSEAASLCAMAPTYFSRRFARTFGEGFAAYQMRFKIQQAARLLATSDEPVSQIGYRLGFRSHAYFSYCFKSVFGVAPSQHRNRG